MKKKQVVRNYSFSSDLDKENKEKLAKSVHARHELGKILFEFFVLLNSKDSEDPEIIKRRRELFPPSAENDVKNLLKRVETGTDHRAIATCLFGSRKNTGDVSNRIGSYESILVALQDGSVESYEDIQKLIGEEHGLRKNNSIIANSGKIDDKKKSELEKEVRKKLDGDLGLYAAINLIEKGVLPIPSLVEAKKTLTPNCLYGIVSQTLERYQSYLKSDSTTREKYLEIEKEIKSYQKEYNLEQHKEVRDIFENWLEEMNQTGTFSFTQKFLLTWKKRWRDCFLNGKNPRWSLSEEATKICKKYQGSLLFEDVDFIEIFGQEKLMCDKLDNTKKFASVTAPDIVESPFSLRFGENMENFSFKQDGKDIYLILDSSFLNESPIAVKLIPHKKTSIWELKNNSLPFEIHMKRQSDRETFVFNISEVLLNHDKRHISKFGVEEFLKGNAGSFRFNVIRKIETDESLKYSATFFQTATANSTKKTENKIPDELLGVFIDIGLNPVITASSYKYDKNANQGDIPVFAGANEEKEFGYASYIESHQFGKSQYKDLNQRIYEFRRSLNACKICVRFYKNISNLENLYLTQVGNRKVLCRKLDLEKVKDIHSVPIDLLRKLDLHGYFGFEDEEQDWESKNERNDVSALSEHIQKQIEDGSLNDETMLKFKIELWDRAHDVFDQYLDIKQYRNSENKDELGPEMYNWLFAIKETIQLKNSISYSHSKPLEKGERRNGNEFKEMNDYFNNFSKNFLCRVATQFKNYLVENNIDFCVAENLEHFRTSELNNKEMNRQLAIWSHRKLMNHIEEKLKEVGIPLLFTNSRHSSQLDPSNQNLDWGCRDNMNYPEGDKEKLWLKDGTYVNADVSATKILAHRFFTRHREIRYIKCLLKEDGTNLVISDGERTKSYFKRTIGKSNAILQDGKLIPITNKKFNLLKEQKSKKGSKSQGYYAHQVDESLKWVDFQEHKQLQQDIRAKAMAGEV